MLKFSATDDELKFRFYLLQTPQDIAHLLEISDSFLRFNIYAKPDSEKYKVFTIPKKSGGERQIFAPNPALKFIQRKLNHILQIIFKEQRKKPVFGFVTERDIVKNAKVHEDQRFVFNLDFCYRTEKEF
jgi:RNA-directed DNA polymerase